MAENNLKHVGPSPDDAPWKPTPPMPIDWRKVAARLRDRGDLAESAMRHFSGDPSMAAASMVFRGLAAAIEDGLS